ncbi:MAG: response regulator transcription factor [bacterium]
MTHERTSGKEIIFQPYGIMQERKQDTPRPRNLQYGEGASIMQGRMRAIRLFVAQDDSLFCEGVTGLIRKESTMDIIGTAGTAVQLKKGLARHPDVVVLCSSPFSAEELPKLVQETKKKASAIKILLVMEEEVPDEALMHFLMLGIDGYLRRSATAKQLLDAIRSVHAGGVWAERSLLNKFIKSPVLSMDVEAKLSKIEEPLTNREKEIISLLFLGLPNRAIADRLYISEKTVKTHFNNIFKKLKVKNRAQVLSLLIHQ